MKTKGTYDSEARRAYYRGHSLAQLRYAAQDIVETINAWRPGYHPNEGWYMDDLYTVKAAIRGKLDNPVCPHCGK